MLTAPSEAVASGDEILAEVAQEVSATVVGQQRFLIVTVVQQL